MVDVKQVAMQSLLLHRLLAASCMLLLLVGIVTQHSYAQTIDTQAPIIELEELSEGVADLTQVFTVQIAEYGELKDATLYYRREGQLPFTPAPMQALDTTGYFSVSIPTDATDVRTIEYYVQARDEAGNRTVNGFAFDPYKRTLSASPASLAPQTNATNVPVLAVPVTSQAGATPSFLKRRWVQITLGVLAVGALASLASDSTNDSEVVPLTFNLR